MDQQGTLLFLLLFVASLDYVRPDQYPTKQLESWDGGFRGRYDFRSPSAVSGGWNMVFAFDQPISKLEIWRAQVVTICPSGQFVVLKNMDWNENIKEKEKISGVFVVRYNQYPPSPPTVTFPANDSECPNEPPPTKKPDALLKGGKKSLPVPVVKTWDNGFEGLIRVRPTVNMLNGWMMVLKFNKPVTMLKIWRAKVVIKRGKGRSYLLRNMDFNRQLMAGTLLDMNFIGEVQGGPPTIKVTMKGGKLIPAYDMTTLKPSTSSFQPSSAGPSSLQPSSATPSSFQPSSTTPSSFQPSSATPTSFQPSSAAPTSFQPSSATPTSFQPSTAAPSSFQPRSVASSSFQPSSAAPSSFQPSSVASSSFQPSSASTTPANSATSRVPTTTLSPIPGLKYNYPEVLHKSILFYEAQRSGKLPASNRIKWRGDAYLYDKGDNGEDLAGGWFDAGDTVKFNFPMASSVTLLSWGLIQYRDAYRQSGELENMLDSIKWPLDYFIKCHVAENVIYGQVGTGDIDHQIFARPEDMTPEVMPRPVFKLDPSHPGSDLAGEMAAAMAAGSIAFRETDPAYADTLLGHAKQIYNFAVKYKGKYSDVISDAHKYYKSTEYRDELAWGAAWLYWATMENSYLVKAKSFAQTWKPWAVSWDDKNAGANVLLYKFTEEAKFKDAAERFLNDWLPTGSIPYTPKGLAWRAKWGSNRYAANTAFLALSAADLGLRPSTYRQFAEKQIHYMLGDSGRSFVVGFGKNPPVSPHHMSSSCPSPPATCDFSNLHTPGPNPHVLYGALVGGPDQNDRYQDRRDDYVMNEVACDYNAGFQSAVAGLLHLKLA